MILNTDKLNQAKAQSGLGEDELATAIDRSGLNAKSAIHNWCRGNFNPKPKVEDITKLASALGTPVKSITRFDSSHRWARIAPRKARLVTDLIQGQDIDAALSALKFSKKRAAVFVRRVLDSAIASAEENDADVTRLVVTESRVDEGPTIKRFRPKDRGRAHPIMKRTSHIVVTVEED